LLAFTADVLLGHILAVGCFYALTRLDISYVEAVLLGSRDTSLAGGLGLSDQFQLKPALLPKVVFPQSLQTSPGTDAVILGNTPNLNLLLL
jgi:hypothetical protein